MQDRYSNSQPGFESPAGHGFPITPSDADDLPEVTRAIYVGQAGALAVSLVSGAEVTLLGVAAGTVLPLRLRKVLATGTTASALVGLV